MLRTVRRWLIGPPLPTEQMTEERLGRFQALAVLSSDALSSVAYATEEILMVLILAGTGAVGLSLPIAIGIAVLLIIVASSYYQTVHAYPGGGGAYLVTKDNLGTLPSLVAGAALLIDYVLTVAVSISAGVAAVTSAFPVLFRWRVPLALGAVAMITLVNLRGVRESGRVFTIPTYFFITTIFVMIITGVAKAIMYGVEPGAAATTSLPVQEDIGIFLILRAFASGCTALTGMEAISDGVPIFKPPEADNAGKTLLWMVGILVSMFLGLTLLANLYGILPHAQGHETVVSQLARTIFGGESPLYFAVQAATALILILAANTSYSDFPRLSMWMARDKFLPRQLAMLGDRLVYSNGIMLLGTLASALIIIFGASTHALIPLYAVGVFTSFTLSQASMVLRWRKLRTPGWRTRATFNGVGAVSTGIVLIVIASVKFIHGAWIVLLLIPTFVKMFLIIHRHYENVASELTLKKKPPAPVRRHVVIVPIAGLHRGVMKAIQYAITLDGELHMVTVEIDKEQTEKLKKRWKEYYPDIELEVVPSPYRSVVRPLMEFVDSFIQEEGDYVTMVIPEFVTAKWWHRFLHNQTAVLLKRAFLYGRRTWEGRFRVITGVPFYLTR